MTRVHEHKGGWRGSYITGKYTFKSIVECYPCESRADALLLERYLKWYYRRYGKSILPKSGGVNDTKQLIAQAQNDRKKSVEDFANYTMYKRY
jgi:predicted GIY-YIG superfamily endonuclease